MKLTRSHYSLAVLSITGLVVAFSFQNCGSAGSGSSAGSATNASSTTNTTGNSLSNAAAAAAAAAGIDISQYASMISTIVNQYSSYLTMVGISQTSVNTLTGATLVDGSATPATIAAAQAQVDGAINGTLATLAISAMTSAQKTQARSVLAQAKAQLTALGSTSPSANATLVQQADLEIVNRLTTKMN